MKKKLIAIMCATLMPVSLAFAEISQDQLASSTPEQLLAAETAALQAEGLSPEAAAAQAQQNLQTALVDSGMSPAAAAATVDSATVALVATQSGAATSGAEAVADAEEAVADTAEAVADAAPAAAAGAAPAANTPAGGFLGGGNFLADLDSGVQNVVDTENAKVKVAANLEVARAEADLADAETAVAEAEFSGDNTALATAQADVSAAQQQVAVAEDALESVEDAIAGGDVSVISASLSEAITVGSSSEQLAQELVAAEAEIVEAEEAVVVQRTITRTVRARPPRPQAAPTPPAVEEDESEEVVDVDESEDENDSDYAVSS